MDAESRNVLPRRTATRPRRAGRHRSPDRISVPQAAPALVLAVPAPESPEATEIAEGIMAVAAGLCQGAEIRAGYIGGGTASLETVLAQVVREREETGAGETARAAAGAAQDCSYAAVVVTLALAPDTARDGFISAAATKAGPAVMVAGQPGPHPVLGAALHDRLAEAGLAERRRISGLSLVPQDTGVLLTACGGEDSLPMARAAAIMLAARLGVPVAAACTGSPDSISGGVATLRGGGVTRLAMAPYLIGPEISAQELASVAAAAGAECAPPLGSHPAVGRLVTMRYGTALLEAGSAAQPGDAQPGDAQPGDAQPGGAPPGAGPQATGRPGGQGSYRTTPSPTAERSLPSRTSTSR